MPNWPASGSAAEDLLLPLPAVDERPVVCRAPDVHAGRSVPLRFAVTPDPSERIHTSPAGLEPTAYCSSLLYFPTETSYQMTFKDTTDHDVKTAEKHGRVTVRSHIK